MSNEEVKAQQLRLLLLYGLSNKLSRKEFDELCDKAGRLVNLGISNKSLAMLVGVIDYIQKYYFKEELW